MSLIRWNPRAELASFDRDPLFRRLFDVFDEFETNGERRWSPRLDLVEEKDRLVATLDLPGVDPKNIQIHLQGDVLTIQGERVEEAEKKEGSKVLQREQFYGSFTRTMQLPYHVQADKVKAQYRNGVMTVSLPKAEQFVGRSIPVETAK